MTVSLVRQSQALICAVWLLTAGVFSGTAAASIHLADAHASEASSGSALATSTAGHADEPPVVSSRVEQDLIYKILVAELAGRRGNLKLSLTNYLEVAQESRDPRVAERAVRIAVYARDMKRGLEAARLWAELAPESNDAGQIYATLLIRSGQIEAATSVLRTTIERLEETSPGRGYRRVADMLAREKDKPQAIKIMRALVADNTEDANARYALGELLGRSGELSEAAAVLEKLVDENPAQARFVVFYAQLLRRLGERDRALEVMADALARMPESTSIRLTYARLLVDAGRFTDARTEFERLVEEQPNDKDIRYALAVVLMQVDDLEAAAVHLRELEYDHQRRYAANYYLGQIAETAENYEEALKHYGRVDRGEHRLNAQIRVAVVMAETGQVERARGHLQGLRSGNGTESVRLYRAEAELLTRDEQLKEAMTVYNVALKQHRENGELLYARAMLAEKLNMLEVLEQDLRDILSREPDNADALNALGYTLADRTDRFDEAHELIKRAHELKPDDHYIVDSLGWVLFRLGRHEEAVTHLRRAFALRPDPEIAAHLGEVLWVMGQKEAARDVVSGALEGQPDDVRLLEVKRRFGI